MDLYREEVMDHYEHPRNQGELSGTNVRTMRDSNASCGDMVQFYIKIGKSKIIEDVKWKGIGCAITTAAASKMSEYLIGKNEAEIAAMSDEDLVKIAIGFEVNPGRMKCLLLPVRVVKKMIL